MNILYIVIACVLSGILYRLGGTSKGTKWRDLGCPTILMALVILLFGFKPQYWWLYLLFFGSSFGALTTYWDSLFGYDNFWFHGFMIGAAGLFLTTVVPWPIILVRIIVCTVGMGLWSKLISKDILEECGRGVFFIL